MPAAAASTTQRAGKMWAAFGPAAHGPLSTEILDLADGQTKVFYVVCRFECSAEVRQGAARA